MSVQGKRITLGVSGGIAAYKACTLSSALTKMGATVRVIMTESATNFVSPLTFQALSRNHVYVDTFEEKNPSVVAHIDLADNSDLVVVAPATANIISKLANGMADDMLSTTLLATEAPVWFAPTMNGHMYFHPAVQANMEVLQKRGIRLIEPGSGMLACGYEGKGRMAEPERIVEQIELYFSDGNAHMPTVNDKSPGHSWWKNKRVLITAGPTQEAIDPVRYISNYSSGKMGYALAEQAIRFGATVTLISGPVHISPPDGAEVIPIRSTTDMYKTVMDRYAEVDVVIKTAAVSDFTPVAPQQTKIKKDDDRIQLELKKTVDILNTLGKQKTNQLLIGFAAETNNVHQYAQSKLKQKNLDYIVANNVREDGVGFGTDTNAVTVWNRFGKQHDFPLQSKQSIARNILEMVANDDEKG